MSALIPLILTLLTPVSVPVSGGRVTEFRFIRGLVPWHDWTEVTGFPFLSEDTFTEITIAGGEGKTFRVLSSGSTSGLHASIGSMVTEEGHAGFLTASGVSISLCDFTGYSLASNWRGITLDYRENEGLQGEYRCESVLLAGGSDAFTAGVSPEISSNLRLGPAWYQDSREGRLLVQGEFSSGCLIIESGGAVVDHRAVHRTSARLKKWGYTVSAGYDGSDYFGVTGIEPLCLLQWPDWGISSVVRSGESIVLCLSHGQRGRFQGELQLCISGITGGFTINRIEGGDFSGGFILGVDI